MIKSMTGFARRQASGEWGQLAWELRTVNHRYLDVSFRLPEPMRALESEFRARISKHIARGKCEASLKLEVADTTSNRMELDADRLDALSAAIREVTDRIETQAPDPLRVLSWPGVLIEQDIDQSQLNTTALSTLDDALAALAEARSSEGSKLSVLLTDRANQIEALVADVTSRLPVIRSEWEQRLRDRLAEFKTELEPGRIEQEFLLLLNKTDAAEELDRLTAHVQEIHSILKRKDPVGRRLDFLIQELNREANTLGSKSQDAEITRLAVELKVAIEQMREQVQNIE